MTGPEVRLLEERRDRIVGDLRAIDGQIAVEELDEATGAELRRRSEVALADTLAALEKARAERPRGRSPQRIAIGLAAFTVAATAAVIGLAGAVNSSPTTTGGGIDLANVTNEELEEVVAANPDVVPMRLALARRYVEAGEFSAALPHYLYILESGPEPEALMYLGWMTHLSGDPATGESLLERSLELQPGNVLAQWFLANVRYFGLGDTAGAIPLLEAVIASHNTPADIVAEAERMIAEAES
ncbi:MAG: tetratricopeptide repeat protein [Acidimicrobiia bacterium]